MQWYVYSNAVLCSQNHQNYITLHKTYIICCIFLLVYAVVMSLDTHDSHTFRSDFRELKHGIRLAIYFIEINLSHFAR